MQRKTNYIFQYILGVFPYFKIETENLFEEKIKSAFSFFVIQVIVFFLKIVLLKKLERGE